MKKLPPSPELALLKLSNLTPAELRQWLRTLRERATLSG